MERFLLLFCLIGFGAWPSPARSIELPVKCKKILDKNLRGWKYAEVPEEVKKYFRDRKLPFKPNLVNGDWNGDRKIDYAVLITRGNLYNSQNESSGERRYLVAFVSVNNGFRYLRFEGSEYLAVIKKGSKGYDYETGKKFHYRTDAVFDGFWEKGGVSYVWKSGKFRVIATSD